MNNEQFRRLLVAKAAADDGTPTAAPAGSTEQRASALGSKRKSIMPMTPRTVKGSAGIDFARQVAENNGELRPGQKSRKFRTTAPKGSKLAQGYQDRTRERFDEEKDDTAQRIKALEESFKLGELEQEVFDRLRDEITGGDIEKTHLVKGLDYKLLEKIRRGEDVLGEKKEDADAQEEAGDIDDEFEQLETKELVAVQKEQTEKKGQVADPLRRAATKKTRDEILAELKASRKRPAQEQAPESTLNSKFRKIGAPEPTSRLERDEKGRDVLVITDADGNVKRKVRKVDNKYDTSTKFHDPAVSSEVLGADVEVPDAPAPAPAEDSDDDIYADVGDDYNPLGDMDDDDSEDEDVQKSAPLAAVIAKPAPDIPENPSKPRNYFKDDLSSLSVLGNMSNPLNDPKVLAALAQKENAGRVDGEVAKPVSEEEARLKRRAEMLSGHDRDLDDMDMGFGSNRHDDAEEMSGTRVKISEWKGVVNDDDDEEDGKKHDDKPRKRGPKKGKQGDKNKVADVMKVIERQRG
jgi:hypothetical protein